MPRYQFRSQHPDIDVSTPVRVRQSVQYQSEIEARYPRVMQAIQALWGHDELTDYFANLMIDQRGDRDGFPPGVWEEIYLLENIHRAVLPYSTRRRSAKPPRPEPLPH